MTNIGQRLRTLRNGMSQAAFSKKIGVPQTTWSNYESGKNKPDFGLIERLCEEFNVSADWLLFGKGVQSAKTARIQIDKGILFDVVETLEEMLKELDGDLEPSKKAELICLLYDHFSSEEAAAKKPAVILRLIKGAMAVNE